jgi:hypothetical protein
MLAQYPVVLGSRDCEITPASLEHLKFQETVLDLSKSPGIGDALQNFAEVEVGQAQSLTLQFPVEPVRFWILVASQVVNPNGGIHDDHAGKLCFGTAQPRAFQITFPSNFAPEFADRALGVGFRQQAKACFHRRFFGGGAAAPQCLPHQAIVNIDICPHTDAFLCVRIAYLCV